MLLWLSLTLSLVCLAVVGAIVVRRVQLLDRPVVETETPNEAPSKPVKRRSKRRIIPTDAPPPPPPPPPVLGDAAPAEEVSFEKLIDLVDVNLETNNLILAEQYLEELRTRFMDKPPIIYFEHMLALAERKGDPEMEVEALEQMVHLEKEELAHVERLAERYVRLERTAEAEALLGEALAHHPENLALLKVLVKLYRKIDAHEKAVELKQRIHHIEEQMRHRGELPPDPESYATAPPVEPPTER